MDYFILSCNWPFRSVILAHVYLTNEEDEPWESHTASLQGALWVFRPRAIHQSPHCLLSIWANPSIGPISSTSKCMSQPATSYSLQAAILAQPPLLSAWVITGASSLGFLSITCLYIVHCHRTPWVIFWVLHYVSLLLTVPVASHHKAPSEVASTYLQMWVARASFCSGNKGQLFH